jgi:hypothetical protein
MTQLANDTDLKFARDRPVIVRCGLRHPASSDRSGFIITFVADGSPEFTGTVQRRPRQSRSRRRIPLRGPIAAAMPEDL